MEHKIKVLTTTIIATTYNKMEVALATIKIALIIITATEEYKQHKWAICFKMHTYRIVLNLICMQDRRKIILWFMDITESEVIMELLGPELGEI